MIHSSQITTSDVAHHYDELDSLYRKLWGTHLHHGLWEKGFETKEEAVVNLSHKVLSLLGNYQGMHLLDIGCGYGGTARLAARKGAGSVTGITLSQKQFDFARDHVKHLPLEFILGDWLKNDFPDNVFDGAFSIECFSHVTNKKKFFDEVRRTLKPGGKFVMAAWLSGEKLSNLNKNFILEPICTEGRLPSLCNKNEVMELISSSGMRFIEHIDLSEQVAKTWSLSLREVLSLFRMKEGLKYFLNANNKERFFAVTVLRILLGYKTKSFRYGLFVMEKS